MELEYDMLVGADGVNSRVRKSLEENVPDFTVRQREVTSRRVFRGAQWTSLEAFPVDCDHQRRRSVRVD